MKVTHAAIAGDINLSFDVSGVAARKIVVKAKVKPWSNFFNTLRASAETDLMDEFGLRKACQWAGNSPATAVKNYALVRHTDFQDEGSRGSESDAKSDAISAADAKNDAAQDSTVAHGTTQTPIKNAPASTAETHGYVLVGDEGLEPLPKIRGFCPVDENATPNPTRSVLTPQEAVLIRAFRDLPSADRHWLLDFVTSRAKTKATLGQ